MTNFYIPTNVIISGNAIENLSQSQLHEYFVVSGEKTFERCDIKNAVEKHAKCVGWYSGVTSNPKESEVDILANEIKKSKATAILSIGGGSTHDIAKAAQVILDNGGHINDFTVDVPNAIQSIGKPKLPLITIPTICGTGAEISPASLIIVDGIKKIVFSRNLFPQQALIDTRYIFEGASPYVIAATGYDAFVQALESFVSPNHSELSDGFATLALQSIIKNLPDLTTDTKNPLLREKVAVAAIQALIAVTMAGVGGIHALSDPLSARLGLHHGYALSLVSCGVIRENYPSSKDRYDYVSGMISSIHKDINKRINLFDSLPLLFAKIGLDTTTLNEKFIDEDLIPVLVKESFNPDMEGNPCKLEEISIYNIFKAI